MSRATSTCPNCKNPNLLTARENYHYTASGLKNVTLVDVELRRCVACGWSAAVIPNVDDLHRLLAMLVTEKKSRLVGSELRFLRKYLGESSGDFASMIGVTPETISRWENEKEPVSTAAERVVRLLVIIRQPRDTYPAYEEVADQIRNLSREVESHPTPLGLRTKDHTWERTTLAT